MKVLGPNFVIGKALRRVLSIVRVRLAKWAKLQKFNKSLLCTKMKPHTQLSHACKLTENYQYFLITVTSLDEK